MHQLLRNYTFVKLWSGSTASGLATWALPFILGLQLITDELDATQLGIILAARTIGLVAIMPLAGALADMASAVRTVRIAGLLAAISSVGFAMSGSSLVLMSLSAAAIGAGQGACRPAFQSLIAANIVGPQRQAANAANTLSVRLVVVVAPTLAAIGSRTLGTNVLLLITAALWVLVVTSTVGIAEAPRVPHQSLAKGFQEGFQEARKHRWFMAGLGLLAAVIMFGYSATGVLLPLVSEQITGTDTLLAMATTGYGFGAIIGAVLMIRWVPKSQGWWAFAGLAAYGLVAAAMAVALNGWHWWIVVTAYVLAGVGIEVFNVPWFTCVQREMKPELIARVSSLDFLVSYGLAPAGLALMAPAVKYFGLEPVLWAASVACLGAGVLATTVTGARTFHEPHRKHS
ncbi:MFS transporter [Corynebacterium sp.]|uniref:MFS transporter n=1 Tax=Corynebacterium sp. TaxID=1720 RepID=UPI0026DB894E|nr:MFS transporter [Corynebacterium sp.]MDO5077096.1 MFS transporter [Corynebacterium sp.]